MNNNIFDIENILDIPKSLRPKIKGLREDSKKLLSLFEIEKELSIDHILVGLARKYKMSKERSWVSTTIWNLKKKDWLEEVENKVQTYRLTNAHNKEKLCRTCGFEIEKEHPMYTLKYPIFEDCEVVNYETSHYCIEHRPKTWRCDDPRNDEQLK